MSQFMILAHPRHSPTASALGLHYRHTTTPYLVTAGREILGAQEVFVVDSPKAEPFETWFDEPGFSRVLLDEVIEDCVDNFASLTLFYADHADVDQAVSLPDMKQIIDRQWGDGSQPRELDAVWRDRV
jgi:hypothetical protein